MNLKKIAAALTTFSILAMSMYVPEMPDLSLSSMIATASEQGTTGNFTYQKFADHVDIISYNKTAEDEIVTVPDKIDGVPVTGIGYKAFALESNDVSAIKEIILPDSVTVIDDSAFQYCKTLETIHFPASLYSIGDNAFESCQALQKLQLPEGLVTIGSYAFRGCNALTSVSLPSTLKSICSNTYSSKFLFGQCVLEELTLAPENPYFKLVNNVLMDTDETIIYKASSTLTGNFEIPDTVTDICESAFFGCTGLTGVTFGAGISSIPNYAFSGCRGLEEVKIPETVSNIGSNGLWHIAPFAVITIENPYCTINYNAFATGEYTDENGETKETSSFLGTLKGYDNSTAESYALNYKCAFESLGVSDMVDPATTTTAPYTTMTRATTTMMTTTRVTAKTTSSTVQNTESVSDGTFKYTVYPDLNYATVIGLEKADAENITIPAEINNVPVTGISSHAFSNSGITSVSIPDTIISIPMSAFYKCENLTSVDLPSGLTQIGSEAFKACTSLKNITLPDTLTTIDSRAFEGAGLTEITIPGSVSNVTGFYGCHNLTNVVIQEGATAINYDAFTCCRSLTNITLPSTITQIATRAFASCDALESIALPESLTTLQSYAFAGCRSLKEIILPDSLVTLNAFAFQQCTALESVTLSKGMTELDMKAFNLTGIKELTIPETITTIRTLGSYSSSYYNMIYDLPSLETINVDENNPNYESENGILFRKSNSSYSSSRTMEMFPPARTGHYTIPADINLGSNAFYQSRLTTITLNRETNISSQNMFAGCPNLTAIEVPAANTYVYEVDGVLYKKNMNYAGDEKTETIALIAFPAGKDTESFVIPDGVNSIANSAFKGCTNLKSVTIPDSVTSIDTSAFENSGLTEITIPDSVILEMPEYSYSSVSNSIFRNCKDLKNVKLSNHMQIISSYMFYGCTALESVILPENLKQIQSNAFASAGNNLVLNIPDGTQTIEQSAFQNAGLISIQFPDSVTALSSGMFRNCTKLTSVRLPADITAIPSNLFSGCTALEEITIPEGVLEILSMAFQDCTSLTSVSLPDSLMNIYANAFQNCSALEEIAIPANVSGIEQIVETTAPPATSEGMTGYSTIATKTTTVVGDTPTVPSHANAFPGCDSLKNFIVAKDNKYYADIDGVLVSKDGTEIRQYPAGRTGSYEIPAGVTKIASNAFLNDKLSGVVIPDSMEEIGSNAFRGCENLADVTLPDSLDLISYGMFNGCTALKQITLPGQVKSINSYAFYQTSLTDVKLSESVQNVYSNAYGGNDLLKEITFLNPNCTINKSSIAGYSNQKADETPFVSDEPDFDTEYTYNSASKPATLSSSLKSPITVYGYDNSSAQKFAEEKKYPFKSLGESPIPIVTETTTATSTDIAISSTTTTTQTIPSDSSSAAESTTTSEKPMTSTMSTPQTTETAPETTTSAPEAPETSVLTTSATTISEIIPDETTSSTQTTEIISREITGYQYLITGKEYFCFAEDTTVFAASDLIAEIQKRAVYSDDSTGEWEDFTDWERLDFKQQNPASVFETWEENQYSAVILASITDILPDGTESVQDLETGSAYIAMRGDIDLSNTVNASSAANILVYVAEKGSGLDPSFNPEYDETTEKFAGFLADVNDDGDVNASDAACVLVYASIVGSKGSCDWETEVFQSN
ncbi:MAG: leucine-rich repeat protein [Oscillospiraceae bacterium]|nr:leucine-rich repeat protein [Oscillospiraceae bacterium]